MLQALHLAGGAVWDPKAQGTASMSPRQVGEGASLEPSPRFESFFEPRNS